MASADLTVTKPFATIESDTTQRTVTLGRAWGLDGSAGHFVLTNIGAAAARIGSVGETLANAGTAGNDDGQTDLAAGESVILDRACEAFVHKSAGTTLRLVSGQG